MASFNKICYLSMYDMGLTSNTTSTECSLYVQEFIAPSEANDANVNTVLTDPAASNRIYYKITTFFTYYFDNLIIILIFATTNLKHINYL